VAELKLPRLPDRTPVKMVIQLAPALKQRLDDYATLYREKYGAEEPIGELIPAMLAAFLDSDREFARRGRG
jgi:hypothetical protein